VEEAQDEERKPKAKTAEAAGAEEAPRRSSLSSSKPTSRLGRGIEHEIKKIQSERVALKTVSASIGDITRLT